MIGKHLRDIWEASGRHLGSKGAPRRHPGGTQEAPRGTQGTQESPGGLWSKKVNTSRLKCKKSQKRQFNAAFLKVGVTKYCAWRQNLFGTLRGRKGASPRALYQNRQNPSDEICLGNDSCIMVPKIMIHEAWYHKVISFFRARGHPALMEPFPWFGGNPKNRSFWHPKSIENAFGK